MTLHVPVHPAPVRPARPVQLRPLEWFTHHRRAEAALGALAVGGIAVLLLWAASLVIPDRFQSVPGPVPPASTAAESESLIRFRMGERVPLVESKYLVDFRAGEREMR